MEMLETDTQGLASAVRRGPTEALGITVLPKAGSGRGLLTAANILRVPF